MGNKLSKTQLAELREVFDKYDENDDGKLSVDELENFVVSVGHSVERETIRHWITQGDKNDDESLSWSEFTKLIEKNFLAQFKKLDTDNDGVLTADEVIEGFNEMGFLVTGKFLAENLDQDGDGKITLEEFIALSFSTEGKLNNMNQPN
eukprot:TRINITY_DN1474_c0_g1_i3.p1 TRINITY_DN1474_c0_g1~~TRINITY_DN1474_c0_g1_i3.p1  ORF type:complete len:149 (-),score=54.06 TRINITY_DN1474_c0_g1_i3:127-573(-)